MNINLMGWIIALFQDSQLLIEKIKQKPNPTLSKKTASQT